MPISKTQCLTPLFKIYKGMKIIITKNLCPKFEIVNESTKDIKNVSLTNLEWIQKDVTIHPPINVLLKFNGFIEKDIKLQNIN